MTHIDFSRNLIKGRIAETIFEEMFRLSGEFTVIPIGYEHTIPELAQYQHHIQIKQVLDNIRNAPDFALISQDKEKVFLVEVKYRKIANLDEIQSVAKKILEKWSPVFVFLATNSSFYFDSCFNIVYSGNIKTLSRDWILTSIQNDYLYLLNEFIK